MPLTFSRVKKRVVHALWLKSNDRSGGKNLKSFSKLVEQWNDIELKIVKDEFQKCDGRKFRKVSFLMKETSVLR